MCGLVGVAGPKSGWLPGFALCGGYWLLVGGAGSQSGCLWNPWGTKASAGSLESGSRRSQGWCLTTTG